MALDFAGNTMNMKTLQSLRAMVGHSEMLSLLVLSVENEEMKLKRLCPTVSGRHLVDLLDVVPSSEEWSLKQVPEEVSPEISGEQLDTYAE